MARTTWIDMDKVFDDFEVFGDMGKFFGDTFRGFDDVFGGNRHSHSETEATDWIPSVDVLETGEGVEILAEIPGVSQEDINISLTNNVLTLKGEKKQINEGVKNVRRTERKYGSFHRSFTLPLDLQLDAVRATFKDGVLTVSIPQAKPAEPREVEINVG